MYVNIHARDVSESEEEHDLSKPGKSMWLNARNLKVSLSRTAPGHLGQPPWHIEVSADMTDEQDSYRAVWRHLEMQLTPSDLSRIFAVAVKKGLFGAKDKGARKY